MSAPQFTTLFQIPGPWLHATTTHLGSSDETLTAVNPHFFGEVSVCPDGSQNPGLGLGEGATLV
jgi:hypothetical protein